MDRVQLLLLGLPLFLLCTDVINLFAPPPPKPSHHHNRHQQPAPPLTSETLEFPVKSASDFGGIGVGVGVGNTVEINFCASCSYRGTAVTMKKMLETAFYGIEVILANYPPPLPKRVLAKLVPAVQIGVIGVIMAGEHIFPMLRFRTPPPWYYSLRANKFGSIATTWLLGNFLQSFLQSSGAFEVYCNNELVSDLSDYNIHDFNIVEPKFSVNELYAIVKTIGSLNYLEVSITSRGQSHKLIEASNLVWVQSKYPYNFQQ